MSRFPFGLFAALGITVLLVLAPVTPLVAAAGFALLAYFPGRLLLPRLGIEGHFSAAGRTLLSVAVSLTVVPFFLNPLWHLTHDSLVMLAAVAVPLAVLALLRYRKDTETEVGPVRLFEAPRTRRTALVIGLLVTAVIVVSYWPSDLPGYPVPASVHDFVKHHGMMDSFERRPLPLGNVFYAAGANEPVHYYHFFYLIPATVRLWTDHMLSIEAAFAMGATLVALSLCGMFYALTKRVFGEAPATLALALVTVVGSLDVIPAIAHMLELGRPIVVLDAWVQPPFRVHNFLNQMIWSPQNVSGVLVVMVGVYMLSARGGWTGWLWLGPILGASLLGSSVWVAFGALPALAVWALTRPRHVIGTIAVGVLMLLVCLPTLLGYADASGRADRGLTLSWPENDQAILGRFVEPGVLANLLDAPFTLTLEFGAKLLLLAIVPYAAWKKAWRDAGLRWLLIAAVISVTAYFCVRTKLPFNDLGQKMIMLSMAFTAIMASCAVAPECGPCHWWNPLGWRLALPTRPRLKGTAVAIALILGLPMGLYEAPLTAARRYVPQLRPHVGEPSDIEQERAAVRFMRNELDHDAVVQAEGTPERAVLAQLIRKQIGIMEPQDDVFVFDPVDPAVYLASAKAVLGELRAGTSADRLYSTLRAHRVTHVFIGHVERRMWDHLGRFADGRYFETVFESGETRVVALRRSVSSAG